MWYFFRMGRPKKYRFDENLFNIVRELAKDGKTEEEMCVILGISTGTLHKYKRASEKFKSALKEGRSLIDEMVEQSLLRRAMGYTVKERDVPPDVTACIFWLKNRDQANWRDRREFSGELTTQKTHAEIVQELEQRRIEEEKKAAIDVEATENES